MSHDLNDFTISQLFFFCGIILTMWYIAKPSERQLDNMDHKFEVIYREFDVLNRKLDRMEGLIRAE